MQTGATARLRPVADCVSEAPLQFEVRVGGASLMGALVQALLEQIAPGAAVSVTASTLDGLGPGDVSVQQVESGRRMVIFGAPPSHEVVSYHLASGSFSLLGVDASGEELTAAIASLTAGPPFVSANIVRGLASRPAQSPARDLRLTPRELDVLSLLKDGLSNREIALALSISINTVRTHLQSLTAKLAVNSRTRLVARARALGLE